MVRFIIRRKWRDSVSGAEWEGFETVLCAAPELENALRGGYGPDGFDVRQLVGAEIVTDKGEVPHD